MTGGQAFSWVEMTDVHEITSFFFLVGQATAIQATMLLPGQNARLTETTRLRILLVVDDLEYSSDWFSY